MQVFIYNFFIFLYSIAARIAGLFNEKAAKWTGGRKNIFGHIAASLRPGEKRVWFHCASVGEFEQARPLIEEIRRINPGLKILITFFSPSGYELHRNYPLADYVFYLPLDGRSRARRFLDLTDPYLVIFVKYEFWYHYLTLIRKRGIPAALVAAAFREEQPFFKWYGSLFREVLKSFRYIFVHDADSAGLLQQIGLKEGVFIAGDTRYDRVHQIAAAARTFPVVEAFKGESRLVIAGSTWPADEELLKECFSVFPRDWKLVIAPHELHADHIRSIEAMFGGESVLFSRFDGTDAAKRVLIVDNMGMLSAIYRYGSVAYVGGGFLKGGIHNTLEPAVFGLPVLFGPVYRKFIEAVALADHGFGFPVGNADECRELLIKFMTEQEYLAAVSADLKAYILTQVGAKDRIISLLSPHISPELSHTGS